MRGGLNLLGWQDSDGEPFNTDLGGTVEVEGGNPSRVFVRGEALWVGSFSSLSIQGQWPIPMGSTRLTPHFRFGRSWNLPLHLRAPLGGGDGFPGLHVDEGRGDGEVLVYATGGGTQYSVPLGSGPVFSAPSDTSSDSLTL